MLRRSFGWLGLWLLLARPSPARDVPPPLSDWPGWMLHDVPQHDCSLPPAQASLGPVLPQGFVATALPGDWPAWLEHDGQLRTQRRPLRWTIALAARGIAPLAKVAVKLPKARGGYWRKRLPKPGLTPPRLPVSTMESPRG